MHRTYLTLLILVFAGCAATLFARAGSFHELPWGCDPFGYLQQAQDLREARKNSSAPDFWIRTDQLSQAIGLFKVASIPPESWRSGVGPHSSFYFPATDTVGIQYPPGTGFILSFFPEGRAIPWIDRAACLALLLLVSVSAWKTSRRGAWVSPALLALAGMLGLDILRKIGDTSYSIQCSCLILIPLCWLLVMGRGLSAEILSGLLMGLLLDVRIASGVILAGFLAHDFTQRHHRRWKRLLAQGSGILLTGALPIALYQKALTGSFLQTPYASADLVWARPREIVENLDYYLGAGGGAVYNWVGAVLFTGAIGLALTSTRKREVLRKAILPATLIWGSSVLFFLLHRMTTPYYMLPPLFAAAMILALECAKIEMHATRRTLAIALLPALAFLGWGLGTRFLSTKPFQKPGVSSIAAQIPAELAAPDSWVFSDNFSGTLWYGARKGSFKMRFLPDSARLTLFRNAYDRHERAFFLNDAEDDIFAQFRPEISALGGRLEPRGEFLGRTYAEILWEKRP